MNMNDKKINSLNLNVKRMKYLIKIKYTDLLCYVILFIIFAKFGVISFIADKPFSNSFFHSFDTNIIYVITINKMATDRSDSE